MHWNEWGLCNWLFQDAIVGRESEQSWVPSLQMPSEACWRGLFSGAWLMSLGSWGADGRCGQSVSRAALATDVGKGSDPRQLFVTPLKSFAGSLPHLLRKEGVFLFQKSSCNIHWSPRSQEGHPRVHFQGQCGCSNEPGSYPLNSQPLVQPEKLHALFEWNIWWKLHGSVVFGKPEDQSVCFKQQSSPINGSCNLLGLWFRVALADVTNKPQEAVRSLFSSVIRGPQKWPWLWRTFVISAHIPLVRTSHMTLVSCRGIWDARSL